MSQFGQNLGYVDELYRRYLHDPQSVSEAWREFFGGDRPSAAPEEAPLGAAAEEPPEGAEPLRGAAARLAENMTASLAVPVATSARTIPVKLLEENRRILNAHQAAEASFKVSFTHLIAWAVVRAITRHPAMNVAYAEVEGKPHRIPRRAVHLGIDTDRFRPDPGQPREPYILWVGRSYPRKNLLRWFRRPRSRFIKQSIGRLDICKPKAQLGLRLANALHVIMCRWRCGR